MIKTNISGFKNTLFSLSVLFLAPALLYIPSLFSPFIRDDLADILKNHSLQNASTLSGIFFPGVWATRPLFNFVNWIQIKLFGLDVLPFHILNVLIHCINGIILFLLLHLLFERLLKNCGRVFPFLISLIFLLHPLQVESVAHINSRSGTLMTAFYLLAVLFFIKYRLLTLTRNASPEKPFPRKTAIFYFSLSLITGILAQFFKESGVTLIFAILVIDYGLRKSMGKDKIIDFDEIKHVLPFFLTVIIVPGLILLFENPHRGIMGFDVMNPWLYFVTQWKILSLFLIKFIVPAGLNFDHDIPLARTLFDPASLAGLSALVTLTLFFWRKRKKHFLLISGWSFFLVTISPTNSLLPNVDSMAERHLYLPLIGLAIILVTIVWELFPRKHTHLLVLFLFYLSLFTFFRNDTWSSSENLYLDTIAKSPGKAKAYNGLARIYREQGLLHKAIEINRQGLKQARPGFRKYYFYMNMGDAFVLLRDFEKAIDAYRAAIPLDSGGEALLYSSLLLLRERNFCSAMTLIATTRPHNIQTLKMLLHHYGLDRQRKEICNYLLLACQSVETRDCATFRNLCDHLQHYIVP